jgi:hypothetical protein
MQGRVGVAPPARPVQAAHLEVPAYRALPQAAVPQAFPLPSPAAAAEKGVLSKAVRSPAAGSPAFLKVVAARVRTEAPPAEHLAEQVAAQAAEVVRQAEQVAEVVRQAEPVAAPAAAVVRRVAAYPERLEVQPERLADRAEAPGAAAPEADR